MNTFTNRLRSSFLIFLFACCSSIVALANIEITVNPHCSCFGQCNGSVDATVTGTFPPFSYSWSNGATTEDLTGVCPGTYILTVTDAQGQLKQKVAVVCEYSPIIVDVNIPDKFLCYGDCVGIAYSEVSGGTPPYSYLWSNQATSSSLEELCAGVYCLTVTDANGCTGVGCGAIVFLPPLTATIEPTNPLCAESCDGSINLTSIGGTPPYSFHWNDGTSTEDRSNLCAGEYCVTITDDEGCTYSICTNLYDPLPLQANEEHANNTCYQSCDGWIDVTVSGGTEPYSYSWNDGSSSQDRNELCAGEYCVTITDAHGCTTSLCITITEPPLLELNGNSTNPTCYEYCNGTISITATGGTPPYSYSWSDGSGAEDRNELCDGEYCVTVYDSHQCHATLCFNLVNPPQLTVVAVGTEPLCPGSCDGSGTANASGGTPPYSYHWSNGSSDQSIYNLCSGQYCVTVTDANGCTASGCFEIENPPNLVCDVKITKPTCYGDCNGKIVVHTNFGTPPYTYIWSNGATTSTITGLCAGVYCVTTTDSHGCTKVRCLTVQNPPEVIINASSTNVGCYGNCNGTASVSASGGKPPYTYHWSNGSTSSSIYELCAGQYCVTVTDKKGCTKTACVTVDQPPALQLDVEGTNPLCYNSCDGSIDVSVSGGTPPYSYSWNDGSSSQDRNELCAGQYCVTVTDAHQCTATACVTLYNPPQLTASIEGTNPLCYQSCDGSADLSVSGGTPGYSYLWNDGTLRHQEHSPIKIPSGQYRVVRQAEYSPQEIRNVAD